MSTSSYESTEVKMGDDTGKTFINEILGQMKDQFNKTEVKIEPNKSGDVSETASIDNNDKEEPSELLKEDTDKSDDKGKDSFEETLTLKDLQKEIATKPKSKTKIKTNSSESKINNTVKRSSSRRSRDCNGSILQSAIARKEKSYNESIKPQRLSRRLKPTQKILDNLMYAKNEKLKAKVKYSDKTLNGDKTSSEDDYVPKKAKIQLKSKKVQKKVKHTKNSESDSDSKSTDRSIANSRTSPKMNVSNKKESQECSTNSLVCQSSSSSTEPAEHGLPPSRLCLCNQNTKYYAAKNNSDATFCTAIDSIDDNLLGCSRIADIENTCLLRSSQRVPYQILCEMHKSRLLKHNCCPGCGVFCTQGVFFKCKDNHLYHRKCEISLENVKCCPHCGTSEPNEEVTIKLYCSKKPVVLPVQKLYYPSAKMTFTPVNDQSSFDVSTLLSHEIFQDLNEFEFEQEFNDNDLLEAIRDNDFKKLAAIIASGGFDLNFKISNFNDGTLLHYAAQNGLLVVCHLLLLTNLNINEFDKEQNTPLMLAISCFKDDVVQYLIKSGANISIKGTDGMTCLHVATKCGNLFATKLILQSASTSIRNFINCQDDGGWTPLVWACEHGHVDVAKYLINQGADPFLRDVQHNEALHWAAFSGNIDIITLLLNEGCDVNSTNAQGESPLHISAREDQYNSVIVLLSRGADVSLVNENNEIPLECVPEDGKCYDVIAFNVKLQSAGLRKYKSLLSKDISKGRELNPIQCLNKIDDEPEPSNYVYVTRCYVNSDDIQINTQISSIQSCNCQDRCISDECQCSRMSGKCWYDEEGKLATDLNFTVAPMIFECNELCSCNAITCKNRLVQKGLSKRFQLYKTESKGWGIKTLRAISKGHFVCEYIGEILTDVEADEREDDSYIFDLTNDVNGSFCVDAKTYGNLSRFINHSCSPNLCPVKVFVEHQDLRFPKIAFFSSRDIKAEEELSFDYGYKFWLIKHQSFSCKCESSDCKYSFEKIEETLKSYQHDNS